MDYLVIHRGKVKALIVMEDNIKGKMLHRGDNGKAMGKARRDGVEQGRKLGTLDAIKYNTSRGRKRGKSQHHDPKSP